MVLWKSPHPDLAIPTDITTWEWAFESAVFSPLQQPSPDLGSYCNAVTRERLDFAQVKEKATKLSTILVRNYGLKSQETVTLFSTNTIWYPVAMWATVRAGGRVNGASPSYTVEEMKQALKTAEAKLLMTLPSSLEVAIAAGKSVGMPKSHVLLLEGSAPGFTNIQELIAQYEIQGLKPELPWFIPPGKTNKDICGYLNFSSGTTGLPKAVMLSHHNVIAQCQQLQQLQVLPSDGSRYRILAVMPLFHITGLVRFCHYPVFLNGDSIMLPKFTMDQMLKSIIEYRIEELILVPPIIVRMVRDPVVDKYLPDLRRVVKRWSSGSAPSSPEIIEQLHAKFRDTGFRQGYGATESTACISSHPPSHFDYQYAKSAGILVANTFAKVISLEDPTILLGPGETGEICAKGPQIAMGYLGNEAATKESFDDEGYLHTGDVGHITTEGLIYIEDRIKEMIKVKGLQVPPAELEDSLLSHPDVEECAVLGIPDSYTGERPKAFVVLKQGVWPSVEMGRRLLDIVMKRKVRYKWLVEIEFTDSIPRNGAGKLLRRVLKGMDQDKNRVKGLRVGRQWCYRLPPSLAPDASGARTSGAC
ncbi:4-coumarate-CoA ligase [Pseudomassariella vexata]|uniref:4-coumarate-CoA ligase n=1 Tax=Pseudomassariella vexata TaxID=1141098 RepID=A0A1Y2E8E0_9PEZI|nr:4-coumarate-CoA ligase [Pseudomassariella vexata]ORY67584.1 4-coumarate-CoA ligase [Pseudomassariella vexata]